MIEKKSRNYIIITACKNEGINLPELIESVAVQTIKPALWVIVDDGSTDDTPKIIEKVMKIHKWIRSIQLDAQERDLGIHLAEIIQKGFDYAFLCCGEHKIEYNYLGNLDGDLRLPPTFYENLIREFENTPKLGVASGGTRHIIDNEIFHAKISIDEPSGGHMLIRRECFEDIEGIPLTYAVDSVIKVKAKLKKWETKRFEDNLATEIRDVNSAEGYWKGFVHKGESYYYLNFNPIHVGMKILKYSFRRPYYAGVAYFVGYVGGFIHGKKRVSDSEIKNYYWNKWKEHL